jgi:hypothetical protein
MSIILAGQDPIANEVSKRKPQQLIFNDQLSCQTVVELLLSALRAELGFFWLSDLSPALTVLAGNLANMSVNSFIWQALQFITPSVQHGINQRVTDRLTPPFKKVFVET